MKTIATTVTTHRNAASTLHASHSTHTAQSPLRRLTLLVTLLMTFALGARAQSVIMSGDYFLTHNEAGTSVNATATTTFNPATCLWYVNDRNIRTADSDGNAFSGNNYLQRNSLTLGSSSQWSQAQDGSTVYYRQWSMMGGNTYYYLRLNGTTWQINSTNSNNGSLKAVTVSTVATTSTPPTINGDDVLTSTGNYRYTASGAAYQAGGYTNYYFNSENHYYNSDNSAITPKAAALSGTAWSISTNEYATINSSTGVVTVNRIPTSDVTLIITATVDVTGGTPAAPAGTTLVGTKEITIQGSVPAAPTISVSGTTVTLQTDATGTTSIRYTIDGTDPTATTGTVYSGAFDISGSTNSPVTIKAITVRNGNASSVTTQQAKLTLSEPVITVNATTGTATINCSNSSATIYYTTDGSAPSATNGTQYNGQITGLVTMATVKAIAICDGWNSSSVASATVTIPSGVSSDGTTVTLFDYEDHKWSYYSDEECPIHSLNPADVKITYNANGIGTVTNASESGENPTSFSLNATTAKVGPNDNANVFVYYKTLERENVDGTGNLTYKTIPNPFLVRPTGNSGTSTQTSRNVYISWSCTNWSYYNTNASVTYTYTDQDGVSQTVTKNSNGEATVLVKVGTTITLKTKAARNQNGYRPTITARLDDNSGTQIGTLTATNTNEVSLTTQQVTAGSSTTNGYRGFYAWRVKSKSAGLSITDVNGNSFANNIIPADTEIRFVTSNEYGNEVEFEALWAQAYVTDGTSDLSTRSNSYERNFHVVKSSTSASLFQKSYPLTVTSYYPDGTSAGGSVTGEFTAAADTKFENITISNATNSTWTANGHDLIVGRGCAGTVNYVRGISGNITNPNYTIRLESGSYNYLSYLMGYYTSSSDNTGGGNTVSGTLVIKSLLGCDYDRASKVNDKLTILYNAIMGNSTTVNSEQETLNITVKSGNIGSNVPETSTNIADAYQSIYLSVAGSQRKVGKRSLTVEGGILSNIAGGIDEENNSGHGVTSFESLYIRMKGGLVRGAIYGGAAKSPAGGNRRMIFTGGTVYGWVGAGCNGTSDDGGQTYGNSKMYIGGDCHVGQTGTEWSINGVNGGYVFGAGKGYAGGSGTSGEMSHGTTLVVADNAYIKHDVYGGGNYGYTTDSYVHILGGNIGGSVFGGSNQKGGDNTFVTMKDGIAHGGVYGGSNDRGTISGNVTIQINGGQVGTSSAPANIHGGGYGQNTVISGNVDITLGAANQTAGGVTVYGDVYGGSALGTVNSDANDHTYVTMNKGTIYGSLYGGALGSSTVAANVNGPVAVKVYGGSVKKVGDNDGSGGVYGANNINGAPQRSVSVDIYGTDLAPAKGEYALYAVYGGGNQADYLYGGYPTVTVHGCDNSIEYVYGGGNAAAVKTTNVTIWGGNVIGNVFGGGHGYKDGAGADVEGDVNVAIKGGTIKKVFGGSNSKGNIGGTIELTIDKDGDCDMRIGEVYGGGNEAAGNAGTINIGCTGAIVEGSEGHVANPGEIGKTLEGIGAVYGGANNANVTNDSGITLNINSGMVANAFGGNNTGGDITGGITVNINKNANTCGWYVGNVYGAGNLAQYSGSPAVNILNGEVSGNVYGGGKGDANDHSKGQVTGNPTVTIGDKSNAGHTAIVIGDVYGGGDAGNVVGIPVVNVVNKCNTTIGNVYGGGNAADVDGTDVNIDGGTITGMVFGGGHGDKNADPQTEANVNGNVNVDITGGTINKVFGGSNSKGNIGGDINLTIEKGDESCEMHIAEVYGGGNEAAGNAGTITIGCTGSASEGIGDVYGGANAADINSGITLNITGGKINRVFGGNNASGSINGGIAVNVNWDTANPCGVNYLGNVYGAGNEAAYTGSPAVNILNGMVTNNVYGGGLGKTAVVTGNPQVTIGDNTVGHEGYVAVVGGDVYGGGDAAAVEGTPVVHVVNKCNTQIGNVYGGGNAADVSATSVTIDGGTITGMIFGGGHGDKTTNPQKEANVTGDVTVLVTGGTINKVFGGSNSKGNIGGDINLTIEKGDESCEMHIAEVYGGGNEAAGNAGTITIGCTGSASEGIGDVYGGANAADINSGITLNITGGKINRVFGGNNASGSINGGIAVNVNWDTANPCGVNYLGNVYGAGNLAPYTGNTAVNILNGTVTGNVFGGGLGAAAVVTGTTVVNVNGNGAVVTQNVLGGGDAANVAGSTDVNMIAGAVQGSVFGGGNAAGVSDASVVDVTGGTIGSGVYGGSNASGTVGSTQVTLTNGQVGNNTTRANVHGGGYGEATVVSGNVQVNIQGSIIYGDVYGGSALGTVNSNTTNTTTVNLKGGVIKGDVYGGGLGDSTTEADVNGNVIVTLDGTAFELTTTTDDKGNKIPTSGRIFGCNNINGSPKGTVLVKVLQTVARNSDGTLKDKPEIGSGVYELQAVYGGGNLAAYNPTNPMANGQFTSYTWGEKNVAHVNTNKPVQVVIDGCEKTSIEYVYGGGNAAATPATDVTVLGSYEIGSVFGGGNGKDRYTLDGGTTWNANNGADVGIIDAAAYATNKSQGKYGTGNAMTSVLGGTVHNIFGGSNTLGNIVGEAIAYLDAASDCDLNVDGIYGGGNEAYMDGSSRIQLGCIESLKEIYGGARNADVAGDVNLTITNGHFDRVFGGNNLGGLIKGSITVNIEETGCSPITIGELYGCGNKAPYKTPGDRHPTINIRSFTSIGNVYGGGLGEKAVVEGNPTININVVKGANNTVKDWSYNGKTINFDDGSTVTLPVHEEGKIGAIGNVFGGGNAAAVIGNTQVNIGTEASVVFESLTGAERTKTVEGADIRGNVYGGGNQAKVTGKTNVVIGK